MKNGKKTILLILITVLFSCLVVYLIVPLPIKWAITAPVDVPICSARVANKLGIQSDFIAVKDHILQSVHVGMTPEEVEQTLGQIGPIEIGQTFIDEELRTHTQMLIRLCNNPFGNVLLFLYYSEDGHLLNVVDANED